MTPNIRLTIDLAAIADNWRLLRDKVAPAECAAVVKANAYGLGMIEVAQALYQAGCRSFYVAYVAEGLALCTLLPAVTIYVLNGAAPGEEAQAVAANLTPIINNFTCLERWQAACGGRASVALYVDTGLHRLGFAPEDLPVICNDPNVHIALLISHLAVSEDTAHPLNAMQIERFRQAIDRTPADRLSLANSSGIFLGEEFHFDQVRPGAALYGVNPMSCPPNPMRNVVTLEARVLQINTVEAGETIGYGATFAVRQSSHFATISIGYADGVRRSLSNRGHVFAAGQLLPIAGRISMDLMTVDITALPSGTLEPGMFVEIIGPNRPVDIVAAEAGTIGYEILTGLASRASRVYVNCTVAD